jgi:copper(I)-binding protein
MTIELTRRVAAAAVLTLLTIPSAQAHGGHAGDVVITHPFATPTPPSASNGAAYFVALENTGNEPDRLMRASTPVAQRVEFHTMSIDAAGVMRMREVPDIRLAPGAHLKMRPGAGMHLMLVGLRQALNEGDSFALSLEFERGGKTEVKVVVQVPKPRDGNAETHRH